jgi:UDP-4-amino-4,6-dideoxy-N-acetyl-beta-L-altrosamine transaminase
MIPYGRQQITPDDVQAVVDVLQSDFITQGPAIPRFEQAVADYTGARFAVAVSSATAALHIGCLALGMGPGKRVWTSPNTFVASANCALYTGASVDFVDIDPTTYNMSVAALKTKLEQAQTDGTLPNLLIPVHFAGQPCDMAAIYALGQQYGFKVMADASHAIGARYHNWPVGGDGMADLTVFSFHPVKIITTGEGGMVLTDDEALYQALISLRTHGITRDPARMTEASHGPWYYQQLTLGYNYRMTDIQAALGASQMQRLDAFVARRHKLAQRYNDLLADLPVVTPWQAPDTYSAFHLYVIRLRLNGIETTHRQVFESMQAQGIGVNLHYIPVPLQPYYQQLGFVPEDYPEAMAYYQEAISLPLFADLTDTQQDQVVQALHQCLLPCHVSA